MEPAVIIVGAGPVGLMLAGELRLAGLPVVVVEERETPAEESRGIGFTARAAEVFGQRGLLDRFGPIESGQDGHFGGVRIDFTMLEDNHFGVRRVPQYRIEHGLEEWASELGATILRGHRLVDIRLTDDAVVAVVDTPDGRGELTAGYLVGCDGGRSTVRQLAGIDFPGTEPTRGMYLADIVDVELRARYIGERVPGGMVMSAKLDDGRTRITIHEDHAPPPGARPPTFTEIADTWLRLTGESIHHGHAKWISAFTDTTRQAAEYRRGRVLLAGDAAHIHLPAGAQGLSVGVQDAVNLGWKLAATIKGWAPAGLLDTYHTERHPVGTRVMRNTQAQGLIYLKGDEMEPLRSVLGELMELPAAAVLLAGMVSGLDIQYEVGDSDHPLLGRRMPDRELTLADGRHTRVFELLRPARGVLLAGDSSGTTQRLAADWADRVDVVVASWQPASVRSPDANTDSVLIRPDGYVAWAAPGGGDPANALRRWFGSPTPKTEGKRLTMPAVAPQKLTTFLAFRHDTEDAINLYTSLFDDAEVVSVIRARAGEPGWAEGTLQHAVFTLAGLRFMCITMPPPGARGHDHAAWDKYDFSPAMAIYVQCRDAEEIDRLYAALSADGETIMPVGSYGFSEKFTWVNDRFGVSWRLNLSTDPNVRR